MTELMKRIDDVHVTKLSAVVTDLPLIVSKRSVKCGELSELVSLLVVLTFRSRSSQ
jgi:hypothetical protein